jgi:hypothetical protein
MESAFRLLLVQAGKLLALIKACTARAYAFIIDGVTETAKVVASFWIVLSTGYLLIEDCAVSKHIIHMALIALSDRFPGYEAILFYHTYWGYSFAELLAPVISSIVWCLILS